MAVEKLHIDQFLQLAKKYPVIDVRSPGEFKHAHWPGAISLPLFTDKERAAVGTAYKQESREQAIKIGLDFFGPKMRKMVEQAESLVRSRVSETGGASNKNEIITKDSGLKSPDSRLILLYCWRGGMRSAAVAWLLDLYGFKIYTLIGGYKKFRNHVLDSFRFPYQLKILGGYTGSGKTEVLKELEKKGAIVVDLEAAASHKGSAFGNIGMPVQPTQEMFENILSLKLTEAIEKQKTIAASKPNHIWLEDESQRIGLVNIPNDLWKTMRQSPVCFMNIPFEERLKHLVEEYGDLDRDRMIGAIERISQRLGGLETKNAINFLKENNTEGCFRILLTYYDRWYLKGLHNRENLNSLLVTIDCDSVQPLNASKLIQQPEYHEDS